MAYSLGGSRSIQLSYRGGCLIVVLTMLGMHSIAAWSPMRIRFAERAAAGLQPGDESGASGRGALMLRGAQTPGELKQRAERLHGYEQLLGGNDDVAPVVAAGDESRAGQRDAAPASSVGSKTEDRLARLERDLSELRDQVTRLREGRGESG